MTIEKEVNIQRALPVKQNGCLEFSIKSSKNQKVTDYPLARAVTFLRSYHFRIQAYMLHHT